MARQALKAKNYGKIYLNADGEQDIDQSKDDFVAVMLYNPDNDVVTDLYKGEAVFFKGSENNRYRRYGTKVGGQNSSNEYDTITASEGTLIGYVAGGSNINNHYRDKDGLIELAVENGEKIENRVYGKNWIPNVKKQGEGSDYDGANFYVLRYENDLNKPYLQKDISRRLSNVALNVLTLGTYGLAKIGTAFTQKFVAETFRLASKKSRKAYKEYENTKKEYENLQKRVNAINDELSKLDVSVLEEVANPNTDIKKDMVFSKQFLDFATKEIDVIGGWYKYGIRINKYFEQKCKKSPYPNDDYSTIVEALFWGGLFRRDYSNIWIVGGIATEIARANNFGFTLSIWNGRPNLVEDLRAYAVAYALQKMNVVGYETIEDADNDEQLFYKTKVMVCSYAFYYLYLWQMLIYVNNTTSTDDEKNWITTNFVNILITNGMNKAYIDKIPTTNGGDSAYNFYENVIFAKKWANNLKSKENYLIYNFDVTFRKMDLLFEEGKQINSVIPNLLKKILEYQKEHKFTAWSESQLNSMKSNIKGIFNISSSKSSAKKDAIQDARKLKSELLNKIMPKTYEYEVEEDKLEVEMNELGNDLEMYDKIYNDESREDGERMNASDKLDELTDKLDELDKKMQLSLDESEKYDNEVVKPKEDWFLTLAERYSFIGNIYAKYKRQDARREFRAKKREMKDFLKTKYGKGWRKEGNWKAYKFGIKVDKNVVLSKYQNIFSQIGHGIMAGFLLPARNIIQVALMLNVGGISTQLEKLKLIADSDQQTKEAIECRNAYLVLLERWYALGGSKNALEKTIEKHGKAEPLEAEGDIVEILEGQGYSVEQLAEKSAEMYDAQGYVGKHYYNAVVSSYITAIVTAVKGFFAWCASVWASVAPILSLVWNVIKNFFTDNDTPNKLGNVGQGDSGIEDACAFDYAMYEKNIGNIEEKIGRKITQEEDEKIKSLILDKQYTWVNAVNEVLKTKLYLETDKDGNITIKDEDKNTIAIALGVGIGVVALGGILWAVFSK